MCVCVKRLLGPHRKKKRKVTRGRARGGRKNSLSLLHNSNFFLPIELHLHLLPSPPPPPALSLSHKTKKMTVAGLTVVGPRIAAAVLLSTALYTLVPGHLTHAEAPASTARYAADGVYRARHPFQSTDRTGECGFDFGKGGGGCSARCEIGQAFVCRPKRSHIGNSFAEECTPASASAPGPSPLAQAPPT